MKSASFMGQLTLLIQKNLRLQLRSIISTIIELLLPAVFAAILLPVRTIVNSNYINETTSYDPFTIDAFPYTLDFAVLGFPTFGKKYCFGYYPANSTRGKRIMESIAPTLKFNLHSFDDEMSMVNFVTENYKNKSCLGAVSFRDDRVESFSYDLRYSYSPRNSGESGLFKRDRDWKTNLLFTFSPELGPREKFNDQGGDPGYYREGFLTVQKAIDFALIREFTNETDTFRLQLNRYPYPPYNNDNFVVIIQALFPFIIMLSFVFTVILTAKSIVYEKETGIKEAMKLMGMKPWVYWLSWYIKTFLLILPSLIFMIVAYKIKVTLKNGLLGSIIDKTDPILFSIFMILYASSGILFTFLCTTFFKKANSAAAGAGVIWFFSYLPYIFISLRYEKMTLGLKIFACILNNLAMSEGIQLIGMFEAKGTGINFSNVAESLSVDDDFHLLYVIIMLIFDHFLYILLLYYFECVLPGPHGLARPWYFPLSFLKCKGTTVSDTDLKMDELNGKPINLNEESFKEDESIYANKKIGIKITNLFKKFKQLGKTKVAVNKLNLNIYQGQITVLLGHNGAGKSTTISMITGLCKPDDGNILINDIDVVKNTEQARSVLGYCPQHNLLFDDLTVYEHLEFFSKLKKNYNHDEIIGMLEMLNLSDKKNALSKNLSGGMKRKLSVAIAFIGGSNIVILDEPSSGMDPQARHSTWSLLQKFRKEKNCTILLTTHFMDEADILGDRIAIMSRGSLKCCGSPLFLKSKYGSGYNLVLTKSKPMLNNKSKRDNLASNDEDINKTADSKFDPQTRNIVNIITDIIPKFVINSNINSEISFILPNQYSSLFPKLFKTLEDKSEELGILNIGVSITTVEDVFLKIGEEENVDEEDMKNLNKSEISNGQQSSDSSQKEVESQFKDAALWIGSEPEDRVNFIQLMLIQFYALTIKRFIHSIRNKILIVSQLLIPICVILINLLYLKYGPIQVEDSPMLEISLQSYEKNYVPINIVGVPKLDGSSVAEKIAKVYENQLTRVRGDVYIDKLHENKSRINCGADGWTNVNNYLSCVGTYSLKYLIDEYYIGLMLNYTESRPQITAHFNNQPFHIPPLTLNILTNALLKYYSKNESYSITVRNYPLPRDINEKLSDIGSRDLTSFNLATGLTFGFSFLLASFVIFIIKERSSNSKHLQYMSGANSIIFWLSALVWDVINYLIPVAVVLVLLAIFQIEHFVFEGRWVYTLLLLFLYGLAHIPQMYLLSYLFKVSASGFAALTAWNILSSQGTLTPVGIISLPQLELQSTAELLEWIFTVIFPNFALGQGLVDLYVNSQTYTTCEPYFEYCTNPFLKNPCCKYINFNDTEPCGIFPCANFTTDYLRWEDPGIGRFILFLVFQFLVQFLIVLSYEAGLFRKLGYLIFKKFKSIKPVDNTEQAQLEELYGDIRKDEDVINEEKRIDEIPKTQTSLMLRNEIFIVDNLTKHYSSFMAVKGVSFSMEKSECFGLLGVNGAGKTTSFKMITGDEFITNGNAYLNGVSLKTDIKGFQQQLGYCPQFDPLIDQMTVLETMYMFARLRGIRPDLIRKTCLALIDLLDLSDHTTKMCYTLSGGNKRKLSVAISLIGSPCVVLLDEPTSGMDPKTRRTLWNCLNNIRNKGKSLILTTHSMDETEALCTNISIMVNGELKCLGSLQNLKSKYGEGYILLVKISINSNDVEEMSHKLTNLDLAEIVNQKVNDLVKFVKEKVPFSELKETRDGFVNFKIMNKSRNILSTIFSLMESNKTVFSIEHYFVSQTNLEQIFLGFASKQIDPESRLKKSKCCSCCSKS